MSPSGPRAMIAVLGRTNSACLPIVEHLAEHGPADISTIAETVTLTDSGARAAIARLRYCGLLTTERQRDPVTGDIRTVYGADREALGYLARWLFTIANRGSNNTRTAA